MDVTAQTLALHGELTIASIGEQRDALLQAIATLGNSPGAGLGLDLDLDGITACDSAGAQLLLSARLSLIAHDMALHVSTCSAPVREVLCTYGLQSLLERHPVSEGIPA